MSDRSPITKDEVRELWENIRMSHRHATIGNDHAAERHMDATRKLLAEHCKEWGSR